MILYETKMINYLLSDFNQITQLTLPAFKNNFFITLINGSYGVKGS